MGKMTMLSLVKPSKDLQPVAFLNNKFGLEERAGKISMVEFFGLGNG